MDRQVPDAMDILQIMARLPHRYPMLLIDRILALAPGKGAVGLKNVSMDEPFFGPLSGSPGHARRPRSGGHGSGRSGAGLLRPDAAGYITHLVSVEQVRFHRQIVPGDQIIIQVVALRGKGQCGKAQATATVTGQLPRGVCWRDRCHVRWCHSGFQ